MKAHLHGFLAILSLMALGAPRTARGEVYVELDPVSGTPITHIVTRGDHPSRVWESVGAAAARSFALNPDGDRRGDGRPDIAVDPLTRHPRAVWAQSEGSTHDIATSSFDGHAWSAPAKIHLSNGADDLDPRIIYRADGVAIVTWWEKGGSPAVRMAYQTPDGRWMDAGVISLPRVKARRPAIRQEGNLTIVAYQTAHDIGIVTFSIIVPSFADGPTPFPRDGHGDPEGDNMPPSNPH